MFPLLRVARRCQVLILLGTGKQIFHGTPVRGQIGARECLTNPRASLGRSSSKAAGLRRPLLARPSVVYGGSPAGGAVATMGSVPGGRSEAHLHCMEDALQ